MFKMFKLFKAITIVVFLAALFSVAVATSRAADPLAGQTFVLSSPDKTAYFSEYYSGRSYYYPQVLKDKPEILQFARSPASNYTDKDGFTYGMYLFILTTNTKNWAAGWSAYNQLGTYGDGVYYWRWEDPLPDTVKHAILLDPGTVLPYVPQGASAVVSFPADNRKFLDSRVTWFIESANGKKNGDRIESGDVFYIKNLEWDQYLYRKSSGGITSTKTDKDDSCKWLIEIKK